LLVDDEGAVLSVTRRLLERLGLRVTSHPTVDAAMAALHENVSVLVRSSSSPWGVKRRTIA
jgi:CheY-like chemotaxis protein